MEFADRANGYVNDGKPWELAKQEGQDARLHVVCTTALHQFRVLADLLKPVLPKLAERVEGLPQYRPVRGTAFCPRCPPVTPSHF